MVFSKKDVRSAENIFETNTAVIFTHGERKLWLAVLANAGEDVAYASMYQARQALSWFLSYSMDVGCFSWVCQSLDLSPDRYRRLVMRIFREREKYSGDATTTTTVKGTIKGRRQFYKNRRQAVLRPEQRDMASPGDSGQANNHL